MANSNGEKPNKPKAGILRLDIKKSHHRTSGGSSVEFRSSPEVLGDLTDRSSEHQSHHSSPQPSVKWAFPPDDVITDNTSVCQLSDETRNDHLKPGNLHCASVKRSTPRADHTKRRQVSSWTNGYGAQYLHQDDINSFSPIEPLGFHHSRQNISVAAAGEPDSEDDDYSISVSAVMQRRASTKGRKKGATVAVGGGYISPRRASSPMGNVLAIGVGTTAGGGVGIVGPICAGAAVGGSREAMMSASNSFDRRRSSVFTSSSAETAASAGDGTHQESTKEQIFENIRLHKEVLQSVKLQPWSMRRKLRLVRQAKEYVARHEGALQERYAMSRSTKDLWARFKILLAARWQHFTRELANISTVIVPWELRIKEIESHFGSVVASYFTFLRWLFWVNIVIAFALTVFVVMPEFMASQWPHRPDDHRKIMLPEERANATRLISIWDFEGFLKYSPLFYGYYSYYSGASRWKYDLPLAYFLTGIVVYIYSFWATLRKMAENSRSSKLSSKDDECVFSWKIFTGWDYMIGHAETAHNRIASVVLGFKEALLEEAEKKKDKRNWKIIVLRGIVNVLVLHLLAVSAYAVVYVVNRSTQEGANDSYLRRNEITVVITAISILFPMFFDALGFLESYHPRKQLRMQLARIMALNLLNLYALIFALFDKITSMNKTLLCYKEEYNATMRKPIPILQTTSISPPMEMRMRNDDDETESSTLGVFIATTISSVFADLSTKLMATAFDSETSTTEQIINSLSLNNTKCYSIEVPCPMPGAINRSTLVTSFLLLNLFSTSQIPTENISSYDFSATSPSNFPTESDFTDYTFKTLNLTNDENNSTASDINYTNPENRSRHRRSESEESEDYYYDFESSDAGVDLNTLRPALITNSNDVYEDVINSTEYSTIATDEDSMTTNAIFSTMTTFLEGITSEITFNSNKEYVDYATTALMEFLTTEYPESSDETKMCYDQICHEVTDVTTQDYWESTVASNMNFDASTTDGSFTEQTEESSTTTSYDNTPASLFDEMTTMSSFTEMSISDDPSETSSTDVLLDFTSTQEPNTETFKPTISHHDDQDLEKFVGQLNSSKQLVLRKLCWETMFGQELVKLNVMDLVVTISSALFMDFFRALFVRFFNKFWCWDLEKRYPKYGDFKIAENILHLVNNQGLVWMGMFFSPGLAILNLIKLVIIMYLRSWTVLTCNVPHEVVFRASRSNNFYLALLLTMLFLCVLPVGYAIVWLTPSWHCGPFSKHERIYHIFTNTLRRVLPPQLRGPLDYISSPSTVIPLLLLLILIIYYLVSLTGALREANQDLRIQLRRERTEGRKKMLKIPKTDDAENGGNAMDRWRKVLEASSPVSPTGPGVPLEQDEFKTNNRKELLARIMKKALRKGSNTSDDDSQLGVNGDETDTEQHDSLPHDYESTHPGFATTRRKVSNRRRSIESPHLEIIPTRKASLKNIVRLAAQKEVKAAKIDDSGVNNKKTLNQLKDDRRATLKKETKERSSGRSMGVACNGISNAPSSDSKRLAEDEEIQEKVVSERRRSILSRQNNIPHDPIPVHLARPSNDQLNYTVVNEKNQAKENDVVLRSRRSASEENGDVFRFDQPEPVDTISDDDNTSYREDIQRRGGQPHRISFEESDPPSADANHIKPPPDRRRSSPDYAEIVKRPLSISNELVENAPVATQLAKPKRRINTFLALVKEVVTPKKIDTSQAKDPEAVVETIPEEDCSDAVPVPPVPMKRRDSMSQSVRRKSTKPSVKRQDSQTSVWSDNIPVITISKTASDECILEDNGAKAVTASKVPTNDDRFSD